MKITYIILALMLSTLASCTKSGGVAPSLSGIVSPPNAPTGLAATAGNALVNLNWTASTSTDLPNTYTVMRSTTSGSGYTNVTGCVNISILTCTDSTAVNGTTYYYVVTASNAIGVSANSNQVSATPSSAPLINPPGSISYSNSSPTYTNNVAITNNVPTVTGGGAVVSWSISPDLTANTGLNFNTSTGVISGTPTTISNPGVSYTITATNGDGTSTVNMTVRVTSGVAAPTISYSGTYTYQAGQTVSPPITPTLGGGAPTSCTASPALPTGFVLNSTTCVISGTPTATATQQLFTITATNAGGSGSGTVNIGVLSSGATNIAITGVASFTTAACALFNLTARDAFGNTATVAATTSFNLSGAGANGAFFSDSACTSTTTSVVIPNGGSTVLFYYRKTTAGSTSLNATLSTPVSPALGSASRSVTVSLSTPAKFGVVIPATGTTVSCNAVTVNVLDSSDNSVNLTSSKTVSLSGTNSPTFYSDAGCTTTSSSLVIGSGANTGTLYMRKTSAGSSVVTAAATGMASGTSNSITISFGPAQRIVFSTSATAPYAAGTCQAYVLQTRDSLGNNNPTVTSDTLVTLSGVVDGAFYPTSSCTPGSEITTTTILNGQASKSLWYSKPTSSASTGGNVTLTAAVAGWTPNGSTAAFSVSTGNAINLAAPGMGAAGIAISTATGVTAAANKCLLTTIRSQDELNTIVPVTSTVTANLTGGGPGSYFSNSTCTSSTTTVTIPAGSSTGSFYYASPTTTSAVAMTWSNGGLSGSGGSRNVTVTNGVPSRLTWSASPSAFVTSTCQTYTFVVRDPNTVTAIPTNVSTLTDFQLADASDGTFYSNSTCSTTTTTVSVPSGSSTATFYYRKTNASTGTISVTLQNPVSPAITTLTQAINVTAPALVANNVLITAAPATGLIATQSCSLLTLQARNGTTNANVSGNQSFTLNGTNGAGFYLDSGCTAVASPASLTITNGTSSVSGIYTKTANTGSVTISATGGLTVNGATLTYSAPPPTLLALSGPILMNAGSTCGNYTIETQDGAGIARAVATNTPITVASTGSVAVQFYSDAACTTALPSNQVTVNSGASTANFYSKGSTPGSASIQVSGSGLTSASQSLTVQ